MLTMLPPRILCLSLLLLLQPWAAAQTPGVPAVVPGTVPAAPPVAATKPQAEKPTFVVREYPEDRDAAIATVGDHSITLGELVDHLEERHHPGFRDALVQNPMVQRMLQSDIIATWVRQYADIQALKLLTKEMAVDQKKLEEAQSAQLKESFQGYLNNYIEQRRAAGRPTDLKQDQINRMLARYQLENGLAAELQGWLNYLEPDTYNRAQLQEFFNNNARAFGGTVSLAHILIYNRDPGRGILFNDENMARASAQLADVRARLREDGSNFEEVAKLCSADQRTAPLGGALGSVHRFDDRLPAALCRAAWELRDGEVSDVVESQYGWHILKRVDFQQHIFILFTEDAIPSVRQVMRRSHQEDILFQAREKAALKLMM
ncbi:MAG: peptidylprolyl isomerase [Planctomycetes bacterium]|nr:peptidylprolyl isomerase [Planctomycetota bacterium]